jgi:hypothetical protein
MGSFKESTSVLSIRYIVETPEGYVTATGTTKNIRDEGIIVLGISGVNSNAKNLHEKLVESCMRWSIEKGKWRTEECRILRYICEDQATSSCTGCIRETICPFLRERVEGMFVDITGYL